MKRRDLIKILEANGCYFKRHGHSHDIYSNGHHDEPVERHVEINNNVASKILTRFGIKKP